MLIRAVNGIAHKYNFEMQLTENEQRDDVWCLQIKCQFGSFGVVNPFTHLDS